MIKPYTVKQKRKENALPLFCLGLFTILTLNSPLCGMEKTSEDSKKGVQAKSTFEVIEERLIDGNPTYLVLGATNKEWERFTKWEKHPIEGAVFWDYNEHDPQGKPYIKQDFNDPRMLCHLAQHGLGFAFDTIVMDAGVYHWTKWKVAHLKHFSSMLKEKGEFVFAPQLIMIFTNKGNQKTTQKETLKEIERLTFTKEDSLPTRMWCPGFSSEKEVDEVEAQFYKENAVERFTQLLKKAFKNVKVDIGVAFPIPLRCPNEKTHVFYTCTN